jgi:hypothetical protein
MTKRLAEMLGPLVRKQKKPLLLQFENAMRDVQAKIASPEIGENAQEGMELVATCAIRGGHSIPVPSSMRPAPCSLRPSLTAGCPPSSSPSSCLPFPYTHRSPPPHASFGCSRLTPIKELLENVLKQLEDTNELFFDLRDALTPHDGSTLQEDDIIYERTTNNSAPGFEGYEEMKHTVRKKIDQWIGPITQFCEGLEDRYNADVHAALDVEVVKTTLTRYDCKIVARDSEYGG